MNKQDFINLLKKHGYAHKLTGSDVIVTHQGYVYLHSLTSMPEGIRFENQGYVYLRSLTSMPENIRFENQGDVYLRSLTSMPENIRFENQGDVYLRSLTSMPENIRFENQGDVYLRSLTGKHTYLGGEREFRNIDGYTMLICNSKKYAGHTVHSAYYFGGGEISKLKRCYVAENNGLTAHGRTMKEAVDDLAYKVADSADKAEIARTIKETGVVLLSQFRALTGACREGTRQHLAGRNIDLDKTDSMSLEDALKAMSGTTFGDTFKRHLEVA